MATSVDTLDTPVCEAPAQAQMFDAPVEKPFNGKMESYHYVWLASHPERTAAWLKARLKEGFHVHHVDGDHTNDAPLNLILIEGVDHLRLHAGALSSGITRWRKKQKAAPRLSEIAAPIYDAKSRDPRSWVEFAKSFHSGVKPDGRIWSDIGMGLQNRARSYARRNGLPWPPTQQQ